MGGDKVKFPAKALEQHVIALGKTGSGKSSKLRVLVEQLLDDGAPVCIIDPKGDWWGLKASADGKRAGYPIVIFGGEHADLPLNAHAGAQVAELIFTGNRSALIDLRGWMPRDRTRFFIDFASTVFRITRGTRYLVTDEVHNFAPKGKVLSPEAGEMLHWANRLASEGRGLGLTLLAASQRPQKVHNDLLTSCETLIACRVIHKADRDAIKDWIDGCADPVKGKEVLQGLATMQRKEAWVWSPEIDFGPERITWPMFATYDSFKPQEAAAAKLKGWAEVDLEEVRSKLQSVVAEAEANDPKKLRAKIAELERTVRALNARSADAVRIDAKPAQLEQATKRGHAAAVQSLRVALREPFDVLQQQLRAFQTTITETLKEMPVPAAQAPLPPRAALVARTQPQRSGPAPVHARAAGTEADSELSQGQRKILAVAIQYPGGVTREQLTVLAGYKKSTRDLYLQQLQRGGHVEIGGDGKIRATDGGRAALPDAEPLPTGQELRDFWLQRLPEGERKIFEVVLAANGEPVDRDTIGAEAGYLKSTRDLYLQRLQRRQLVTTSRGQVAASETLFA